MVFSLLVFILGFVGSGKVIVVNYFVRFVLFGGRVFEFVFGYGLM